MLSLVISLVAFRGHWRVLVRRSGQVPVAGERVVLCHLDVRRRDVAATMGRLTRAVQQAGT